MKYMTMIIVAVLDNIRSLYNVGSIFRTADALGINKIYLTGITGTPKEDSVRQRIHKTALGAEEEIPWQYFANPLDAIKKLKKAGYSIIALEQTPNSQNLMDFARDQKLKIQSQDSKKMANCKFGLVVGHELYGVSAKVLDAADAIVQIPMQGKKESLNVAVAFGIAIALLKN